MVVGRAPGDAPLASVARMEAREIESLKPRDLGQVLALAPGANLSIGQKNETILLLRGMDARRIVLLLDGIPVYEPYYGTFDLKTVAAGDIASVQVTAGPASVLYGPNALAGLVNVVTHRPGDKPRLTLGGVYGQNRTVGADLSGGFRWERFALSGSALCRKSDGFQLPDEDGSRDLRQLSDYRRLNINAKAYFTPTDHSEFLVSGSIYRSAYGLPPALEVQRARYWRFRSWDRSSFSAGGFIGLGRLSLVRFRAYAVQYDNVLEQYDDPQLQSFQAESAFDNSVLGFFGLADLGLSRVHNLKLSLNMQSDRAKTRDETGLPWEEFRQTSTSAGAEHHFRASERLTLIAGLSLDVLDKHIGPTTFKANPLAGVQLRPWNGIELNLSAAKKSRFPSMRSLYSSSSGNPDLLSEDGYALQLGARVERWMSMEFSAFNYEFRDMIDSLRQPDGTRLYVNVGKATIRGLEIGLHKSIKGLSADLNYTFLDHRNQTDDRPLDTLPGHTLRAHVVLEPFRGFRLTFSGTAASSSSWYDSAQRRILDVPAYAYFDAVLSYGGSRGEIFFKASNILDAAFYTDPGFPWPGRTFEAGFRVHVFTSAY
ncbi:MAG: TonB-dependent receptor plug domain-containing protein [Candidatus Aminicenantes bacterium]|nr:TonB-dependent receptor plug domain-containing protein [Candidatus Aminicenantes bacterium]